MCQASNVSRIPGFSGLDFDVQSFLIDRRARGLAEGTIGYYECKLAYLQVYLAQRGIDRVEHVTAHTLRSFLVAFGQTHRPGGVKALYRAVSAFFRWYELEAEPQDWRNPIRRVRPPRVAEEPLEPAKIEVIKAMLRTCRGKALADRRDKAILLALLDTGARARELTELKLGDVDLRTGSVLVRRGKGGKPRTVFLGKKTLRAYLAYLRARRSMEPSSPGFATLSGDPLSYSGLREVVRRRAGVAGVAAPSLHSFRRAFALACLRNNMDVYSLQRLMGHADLTVLKRYLAQTDQDLARAHASSAPVDRLL